MSNPELKLLHGVIATQNVLLNLPVNLKALHFAYCELSMVGFVPSDLLMKEVATEILRRWAKLE